LLTSNVGTDTIMELGAAGVDAEALATALRPDLLQAFPPALLGRLVVIPYYPLSNSMMDGIVRLQLDRIGARIRDNHNAVLTYDDAVVQHIVSRCNDPHSGGRMIDNILTNTLLPQLAREVLERTLKGEEFKRITLGYEEETYVLEFAKQL
jgi:type VI secretion system protein VasG